MELLQKTDFIADDKITSTINRMIDTAEWEIIICSPWLDEKSHIMDKIIKRAQEKTLIRQKQRIRFFVMTRPPNKPSHSNAIEILKNLGADVYFDPQLHAKIMIVDEDVIFLGSTNLTSHSLTRNHEAGILSESRWLIRDAKNYLLEIRDNLEFTDSIKPKQEEGFCIVCKTSIPVDNYKVRCRDCWAKEKKGVAEGSYCHKCGKGYSTTSKEPLCDSCNNE